MRKLPSRHRIDRALAKLERVSRRLNFTGYDEKRCGPDLSTQDAIMIVGRAMVTLQHLKVIERQARKLKQNGG